MTGSVRNRVGIKSRRPTVHGEAGPPPIPPLRPSGHPSYGRETREFELTVVALSISFAFAV